MRRAWAIASFQAWSAVRACWTRAETRGGMVVVAIVLSSRAGLPPPGAGLMCWRSSACAFHHRTLKPLYGFVPLVGMRRHALQAFLECRIDRIQCCLGVPYRVLAVEPRRLSWRVMPSPFQRHRPLLSRAREAPGAALMGVMLALAAGDL